MKLNPYLNFPGTTEEAFNLYKSVFGGEFAIVMRMKDAPGGDKTPPELQNKIMHIALPVAGDMLMATDAVEGMGDALKEGNNFIISISPDGKEEADRIYNGLSEGGSAKMPMQDQFWGDYYGHFTDKFGIKWMINYSKPK